MNLPQKYIFTSHYVSINSSSYEQITSHILHLHPTMYLLIRRAILTNNYIKGHLHPTMYLLILIPAAMPRFLSSFTSHYVSINS